MEAAADMTGGREDSHLGMADLEAVEGDTEADTEAEEEEEEEEVEEKLRGDRGADVLRVEASVVMRSYR